MVAGTDPEQLFLCTALEWKTLGFCLHLLGTQASRSQAPACLSSVHKPHGLSGATLSTSPKPPLGSSSQWSRPPFRSPPSQRGQTQQGLKGPPVLPGLWVSVSSGEGQDLTWWGSYWAP